MALRYFKLTRVPIKPLSFYRFSSTLTQQQQREMEKKIISMETKIITLEETIKNLNSIKEMKTPSQINHQKKYKFKTEPIEDTIIDTIINGLPNFMGLVMTICFFIIGFIAIFVVGYGVTLLTFRIVNYIFH